MPEQAYFFRELGNAVTIDEHDENTVLIGEKNYFGDPGLSAAHMFKKTADGWKLHTSLRPEELELYPLDLAQLKLRGGEAIITSPPRGEAYTFTRQANGSWKQGQTMWGNRSLLLGLSTSLSGNRLLMGATWANSELEFLNEVDARISDAEGDALIFEKNPSGRWERKASLLDSLRAANITDVHGLGFESFLSGPLAVVSEGTNYAPFYPEKPRVHIFLQGPGQWRLAQSIVAEPNDQFYPIALAGRDIWITRGGFQPGGSRLYIQVYSPSR